MNKKDKLIILGFFSLGFLLNFVSGMKIIDAMGFKGFMYAIILIYGTVIQVACINVLRLVEFPIDSTI